MRKGHSFHWREGHDSPERRDGAGSYYHDYSPHFKISHRYNRPPLQLVPACVLQARVVAGRGEHLEGNGAGYAKPPRSLMMKVGDRVFISDAKHPWNGHAGEVLALNETYGLGWKGHRVKLDGNCGETYVKERQLLVAAGKPRPSLKLGKRWD